MDRLERELGVINKLGFPNYFLIVWDFVRFARAAGHSRPRPAARASARWCAYALYLSHVCPLEYDLLFERFLDESRREAPDIDIDFCQQRRGEVIQYVKEKYGDGERGADRHVRHAGRPGGDPRRGPRAGPADPARRRRSWRWCPRNWTSRSKKALEKSDDLKKAYDTDAEVRELLDLASSIEGLARNVGTHAAAVVIADRPLTDYVPLAARAGQGGSHHAMGDGRRRAGRPAEDGLPRPAQPDDPLEGRRADRADDRPEDRSVPVSAATTRRRSPCSAAARRRASSSWKAAAFATCLQRMKPDHFRDIIATNALYRPGPLEGGMVDDYIQVKHGRKKAEYKHPVMKEVLEETHGVMVYQEQVMRILNRLGGIELANAYTLHQGDQQEEAAR